MDSYKKKVWILNHYAITPDMPGITRHYDLAEHLTKKGFDITIFASSFDHKLRVERIYNKDKYKVDNFNGVNFVWIKTYPYKKNDIRRLINIFTFSIRVFFIALKFDSPDTIIASSFHPLTCISGYFLSKIKKTRYISEIRDLWPQSAIDLGAIAEKSLIARILRLVERYIYSKSDKVIVLMPYAYDYYKKYSFDTDKIVYIPNGVNTERYDKILGSDCISNYTAKIIEEHKNKFNILYLGAIGKANSLDVILDAARIVKTKKYSQINIILIGDGPEKERLLKASSESHLDNIFFYNAINKNEVPFILDKADVCLFNLRKADVFKYGVSPNKLFDYLYSGKPIIFACDAGNNFISEYKAGITVKPGDPVELSNAMVQMFNMNPSERHTMGQNGKQFILKYHDINILTNDLINAI